MNSLSFYTHTNTGAVYIVLPPEQRAPIDVGCVCVWCRTTERPELAQRWDVLCVPGTNDRIASTFRVHCPELAVSGHIPAGFVRGHAPTRVEEG